MSYKAKDIAEMVGVSTATVSLVINNKPGVSEQTRQQILSKISEVGCEYLLKEAPVNNGNIGFVIYKTYGDIIDESPFFTYILEGINQKVSEAGYTLRFLYMNNKMPEHEQRMRYQMMNCEGFIIFGTEMGARETEIFSQEKIPYVVLDNIFQEDDVNSVAIDNAQGTAKAMNYLYEMGHCDIGYLRCRYRINSFIERENAFYNWKMSKGLSTDSERTLTVGYSALEIRKAIAEFIEKGRKMPTAFFADNDFIACNALQIFQEMGYDIPGDISMIGFDDRPICEMVTPSLTTICVPKKSFAELGVALLLDTIRSSRETSTKMLIGTRLLVRDSVKRMN